MGGRVFGGVGGMKPMYDAISSDGKTVYIIKSRGSAKSTLQLEMYRKLFSISDEEWLDMYREARERVGYLDPNEGGEE
jgi:hypothetical protein